MSVAAMSWAFRQPLAGNHKVVLLVLADHHNDENGVCYPSVRHIAERACISERTVIRVLQELEVGRYLTRQERHSPEGRQLSTLYRLTVGLSVTSWGKEIKGGSQDETEGEGVKLTGRGEGDTGVTPEGDNAVTPYEPKQEPKRERKSSARGSRLHEDWTPSKEGWDRAVERIGLKGTEVELEKFRNYWLSKAGRDAVKLDWERTFSNWIINASERTNHVRPSVSGPNGAQRNHPPGEPATVKDRIALIRRAIAEGTA